MKKWWLFGLFFATALANAAIVQGTDYTLLSNPQPVANPKKVEVIEFFSYHCIHCYELDPTITSWEKKLPADVDFHREQIVWQKPMEGFARFYATELATGTFNKLHKPAFDAYIKSKVNIADENILATWLKKQPGIDVNKFMQTYKSFGINAQVSRATKMTRDYNIEATPTIVVNGKYALQPAEPARLMQVLNELIAKVKTEKK